MNINQHTQWPLHTASLNNYNQPARSLDGGTLPSPFLVASATYQPGAPPQSSSWLQPLLQYCPTQLHLHLLHPKPLLLVLCSHPATTSQWPCNFSSNTTRPTAFFSATIQLFSSPTSQQQFTSSTLAPPFLCEPSSHLPLVRCLPPNSSCSSSVPATAILPPNPAPFSSAPPPVSSLPSSPVHLPCPGLLPTQSTPTFLSAWIFPPPGPPPLQLPLANAGPMPPNSSPLHPNHPISLRSTSSQSSDASHFLCPRATTCLQDHRAHPGLLESLQQPLFSLACREDTLLNRMVRLGRVRPLSLATGPYPGQPTMEPCTSTAPAPPAQKDSQMPFLAANGCVRIQVIEDDKAKSTGPFTTGVRGQALALVTTNFQVKDQARYGQAVSSATVRCHQPSPRCRQMGPPMWWMSWRRSNPLQPRKAYMCPYMQFIEVAAQCGFCSCVTSAPPHYFQHLDHTAQDCYVDLFLFPNLDYVGVAHVRVVPVSWVQSTKYTYFQMWAWQATDCDKAITVEFKHDDKLESEAGAQIQLSIGILNNPLGSERHSGQPVCSNSGLLPGRLYRSPFISLLILPECMKLLPVSELVLKVACWEPASR
ncbi:protein transport protein Sec24C isoform X2 [Lates japonicus]|uniref:Protein transport protein Sec24C isoform X2 n=1 Tax=Lates japonicus TaxID=270547 RepID=A0AAD3RMQ1_LATJO|nr:protein transport protein Sec24C isoform X2 [Lates japonicus]